MSSSSNSKSETYPPCPVISDVTNSPCTMRKKQNEEILANAKDDNRKLGQAQELHQNVKGYKKLNHHGNSLSSRKRDKPEDEGEAEHKNEHSNTKKKARVSVASLSEPEPELGHVVEPPASFNTLDDDCLGNVLDFVGKKSYSVFGRVNKRCHEMFCLKGLPKVSYLFGYAPLHLIIQKEGWYYIDIARGVLHYNRRDMLEWILIDGNDDWDWRLKYLCWGAIKESRLDILREVFQRVNEEQLERLRDCYHVIDLCYRAAEYGKLECLKLLRENGCEWSVLPWREAKQKGHEHILDYLRNNGYPRKWQ